MPPPEPKLAESIEVRKVSVREFCEHMGIEDETRFIGLQHMHDSKMIWILLEKAPPCVIGLPCTACSDCNSVSGRLCDECAKRRLA